VSAPGSIGVSGRETGEASKRRCLLVSEITPPTSAGVGSAICSLLRQRLIIPFIALGGLCSLLHAHARYDGVSRPSVREQ